MPTFPVYVAAEAKLVIERAEAETKAHLQGGVSPIHLLLALLRSPSSREELSRLVGPEVPLNALEDAAESEARQPKAWLFDPRDSVPFTAAAKAAVSRAFDWAQRRPHTVVQPGHLLLGLFRPPARTRLFGIWAAPEDTVTHLLHTVGLTSDTLAAKLSSLPELPEP